jgi:lipopolysaccharide/colanic/teichoic acid biosynthesis glycosyltransferase
VAERDHTSPSSFAEPKKLLHAEADGKPCWATVGKPRITRVGHYLCGKHLDELPQVDMLISEVGDFWL